MKNPRPSRGRLSESRRIMSTGLGKCRFCNGSVDRETSVRIFPDGSYFFLGKKSLLSAAAIGGSGFVRTGKRRSPACPLMIEINQTRNKRLHFAGGRVIKVLSLFSAALLFKPRGIESLTKKHSQVFVAKVGALLQGGVPRIRHAK